ncbi:MAG TPA: glycosyltransferase family 9 protein [Planctomycetota bacterium]|nr:glycosyltransferase family 9 protein [Planctomycetota bacterium]
MQKILIIRPGALGDFIITLPVAAGLRERYPDAWIGVLARGSIATLAGGIATETGDLDAAGLHAFFERAFFIPGRAAGSDAIDYIRSFDLIISWLGDDFRRTAASVGANVIDVPARPPAGGGSSLSASQFFFRAVPQLRDAAWRPPRVHITHTEQQQAAAILRENGLNPAEPVIGIHPGSGGRLKCWPPEHFARVVRRLRGNGTQVVMFCGEADATAVASVERAAGVAVPVLRELPLRVLAAVLSLCRRYVGNDSGVSHLAAAAGTECIVLFGPSDPVTWAPAGENVRVLTTHVACSPCGSRGPKCGRKLECLSSLAPDRVLAEIER